MVWVQLSVSVVEELVETVADTFTSLGAVSVTIVNDGEAQVLEPDPGEQRLWSHNRVVGLFQEGIDAKLIFIQLQQTHGLESCTDFQSECLPDRQWERVWLEDFKPLRFGTKLHILPDTGVGDDAEVDSSGSVILRLDPGLAFGTGTHPTTAMCLTWLDGVDLVGKTVIDYGCGSGILGIAAALLGAQQVYCIDHDPQALVATRDNARRNNVLEKLIVISPQNMPLDCQVEVLVANILAQPLTELADTLLGYLAKGGSIGLSGILSEQMDLVTQRYVSKCCFDAPIIQEPWCCLVGCKG